MNTISVWFSHLRALRGFMLQQNALTNPDLKLFSLQTVGQLVPTPPLQGNLGLFCHTQQIGIVPPNAFANPGTTMRQFLDMVGFSIEASLLVAFFAVAIQNDPVLGGTPIQAFAQMTLGAAFGANPLPGNQALMQMHVALLQSIPHSSFYNPNGAQLGNPAATVDAVIQSIIA